MQLAFIALLAMPVTGHLQHAVLLKTYPVQLAARDRGSVVKLACQSVGATDADSVSAFTFKRGSNQVQVSVQCTPHRREASLAVAHYTTCAKRKGAWQCEDGYDAAQLPLPDSSILAVRPVGVEFATAIELIRESEKLVYPPFHTPALSLLHGTCTVSKRPNLYSADFQRFGVDCDAGSFAISKVCPGQKCGYFITEGGTKED